MKIGIWRVAGQDMDYKLDRCPCPDNYKLQLQK